MGRKRKPTPPEVAAAEKQLQEAETDRQIQVERYRIVQELLKKAQDDANKVKADLDKADEAVTAAKLNVAQADLEASDTPWNRKFKKLKAYKEQHGHVNLPGRARDDPALDRLCVWVNHQKAKNKRYTEGKVKPFKPYQMQALEDLGVVFGAHVAEREKLWNTSYQQLLQFRQEEGHTIVPQHYQANKKLATWVGLQRYEFKLLCVGNGGSQKSCMTEDRFRNLSKIGFVWNVMEHKKWEQFYEKLKDFHENHGHCNVAAVSHHDETSLSALEEWCQQQRKEYNLYQKLFDESVENEEMVFLNEERIELLNELGFAWEAPHWEED